MEEYYEKNWMSASRGRTARTIRHELRTRIDYPIGYVRWTRTAKHGCFVDLASAGSLQLDPLTSHVAVLGRCVGLRAHQ
jgi:hypothetical protein